MNQMPSSPPCVPKTAKERGKIAPAKLAHVALQTSRYEEMLQWYKVFLEAELVLGTPGVSFLAYDEEHHRIAIINMPGLEDKTPQIGGVAHVAFTYETLDDLFATYERLAAEGIKPFWCINHGATLSMYYRDPDNNQMELQIDTFDSNEATTEWLAESDFETNPIGVKFEPEDLIRRYRAGEERSSLLKRPVIGPSAVPAQLPTA